MKNPDLMTYFRPALTWMECLPLGNGNIGVMLNGGVYSEQLYINDDTFWSGYPSDKPSPKVKENLNTIRKYIFKDKNVEADELYTESVNASDSFEYMQLATISLRYKGVLGGVFKKNYKRQLDLRNAVHTTEYSVGGNFFKKVGFCSYPDKCFCYKVTAEKPFSVDLEARSDIHYDVKHIGRILLIKGIAPDCFFSVAGRKRASYGREKGMGFAMAVKVDTDGFVGIGSGFTVKDATYLSLTVVTSTGFRGYDKLPHHGTKFSEEKCLSRFPTGSTFDEKLSRHIADVTPLYDRTTLSFDSGTDDTVVQLLNKAKKGIVDESLVSLFFNYGKYLTVASSRVGTQATNLQGIWAKGVNLPWRGNYTVNINTEMNYWHIGRVRLLECERPFFELVNDLSKAGQKTAKVMYGCDGFACHHNVDLWRKTTPATGNNQWACFPLAGAWLTCEMIRHRLYADKIAPSELLDYVRIVTEATKFVSDFLVEKDGWYVTCPSTSPEHSFKLNGKYVAMDYATACDMAIVYELFTQYEKLSETVNVDENLLRKVSFQKSRLYPIQESRDGLMEWSRDREPAERGHRHFSPLLGLYPFDRIIPDTESGALAKKLLDCRINNGSGYTGWSAAWAICLYGRLGVADSAYDCLKKLFGKSLFKNLFDSHPPMYFQIDGNFGGVAGITEMLLTEIGDTVYLLRALPKEWRSGAFRGVGVTGGRVLSMRWKDGKITELSADVGEILVSKQNVSENAVIGSGIVLTD